MSESGQLDLMAFPRNRPPGLRLQPKTGKVPGARNLGRRVTWWRTVRAFTENRPTFRL